jgi:protein MAK16
MTTHSDTLVWSILDTQFCSFKNTTRDKKKICAHPMNNSGICHKPFCPLANSVYATVIEKNGKCFLCLKSAGKKLFKKKKGHIFQVKCGIKFY